MYIIIDPGHAGRWPNGDPGAVAPDGRIESYFAWTYANTLKRVFEEADFQVKLTRDQDTHKIPYSARTKLSTPEDLFISLHFDSHVGGRRLIYYADVRDSIRDKSKEFAKAVDVHFDSKVVLPTTASRFGRLYIDDNVCPAILVEIDRIDRAVDTEEARMEFSKTMLAGVREFLGNKKFNTPFQRVFIIKNGKEEQLDIERMSIVGDKLYIATR